MDNRIDCSLLEWLRISESLVTSYSSIIDWLDIVLGSCNELRTLFEDAGVYFEFDINLEMLEKLNTAREKLTYMANGIFYEMSELVDVPFSLGVSELLDKAVEINPGDISVSGHNKEDVNDFVTLPDIINQCIADRELKAEFDNRCIQLNNDEASLESEKANLEAEFWAKEYEKAELCSVAANEIFTEKIRAGWHELDDESKINLINQYKDEVANILSEGNPINTISVEFVEEETGFYGNAQGDVIRLNNDFIDAPHLLYDVDKVIDNITHEMRHHYQNWVSDSPLIYGATVEMANSFDIENYIQYQKNSEGKEGYTEEFTEYYTQDMEVDAKGFAALSGID